MLGEISAARPHPAVIVSVVVAAVAVTVCALVAIAYMLGWVPGKVGVSTPASIATPGQQIAGTVELLPGETLVSPPDTPQPATPRYAKPAAPAAQPATPPYSKPVPGPSTPQYARPVEPAPRKAAPTPPAYAQPILPRTEPPLTSYERSTRSICVNCGTVASIGSSSGDWEVRVRFEDGSSQTLRYPERPRLRVGDRVHLEEGRLIPD